MVWACAGREKEGICGVVFDETLTIERLPWAFRGMDGCRGGAMNDFVNPESGEMVNKKGVPLRGWDTVENKSAKAVGTNKAKALLRRLDRERKAL
jgi:hypothetical protein